MNKTYSDRIPRPAQFRAADEDCRSGSRTFESRGNDIREPALQYQGAIPRMNKPVRGVIRVLLADDHAVIREGLAKSLNQEPDIVIVGEAADGRIAVDRARILQPDVILMDIAMPNLNGIEATREIHSEMPRVRVIALSMLEEKECAPAMFDAGAVAYLSKNCSVDTLTAAIRRCVA
jgi:CheY-like chemotaxis protein